MDAHMTELEKCMAGEYYDLSLIHIFYVSVKLRIFSCKLQHELGKNTGTNTDTGTDAQLSIRVPVFHFLIDFVIQRYKAYRIRI